MKTRVLIAGYDPIGRRVADAVARQDDMIVVGIYEADPSRFEMLRAREFPAFSSPTKWRERQADAVLFGGRLVVSNRSRTCPRRNDQVVRAASSRAFDSAIFCFSLMADVVELRTQPLIKVAGANALAFARVLSALRAIGEVRRWFSSQIVRIGHESEQPRDSLDALRPVFIDPAEDGEISQVLGAFVSQIQIRRVVAPYTHSHLHMLKLDLNAAPDSQAVLERLKSTPRILVGRAGAGFRNTAQLQEFARDLGRWRGDRPEVFVWEESVQAVRRSLYLMVDVEPEATVIPEVIDAIRLSQNRRISMMESVRQTDAALGLGIWPSSVVSPAYV